MGRKESIFAKAWRACKKVTLLCDYAFNTLKLRCFGIKAGRGSRVCGHIYLERKDGAQVTIGRAFKCISGRGVNRIGRNLRSGIFASEGAQITIGDNVGVSCSSIWARKQITIGNNVNIGADCLIMDHEAHSLYYLHRRDRSLDSAHTASAPVVIEDDVLLGARCTVLKGVRIARGSVVGAGSIVTCDIPAGEIWAGNPARFIRKVTETPQPKTSNEL